MRVKTDNSLIPEKNYTGKVTKALQDKFLLVELSNGLTFLIESTVLAALLKKHLEEEKEPLLLKFKIHNNKLLIRLNFTVLEYDFKIITSKDDLMEELI